MTEIQKARDIRGFVQQTIDELESMKSLPATKRNAIITEMAGFSSDEEKQMASKISQGHHLSVARQLAGEMTFKEIVKAFGIKYEMKAWRLIGIYQRLAKMLPPEGLVTAPPDIGGTNPNRPLGMYHNIIDEKSLPKSRDLVVWKKFWDGIAARKSNIWAYTHRSRTKPTEDVKKAMYLEIGRRLRQVAENDRVGAFKEIVGMMMSEFDISSKTKFKPIAVPIDYKPKRGRPPGKSKHPAKFRKTTMALVGDSA